jgi:hypothetical protein
MKTCFRESRFVCSTGVDRITLLLKKKKLVWNIFESLNFLSFAQKKF